MSENQFDSLMGAIQFLICKVNSFEGRFDGIEGRLDRIEGSIQRIEGWTPFNANQDIIDKVAMLTGRK